MVASSSAGITTDTSDGSANQLLHDAVPCHLRGAGAAVLKLTGLGFALAVLILAVVGGVSFTTTKKLTDTAAMVADSQDGIVFSSRQGDQAPQLVLILRSENSATAAPTVTPTSSTESIVLAGAGDISSCRNDNDELTAQLLDSLPGTVFTVGDNVYPSGTYQQFMECYEPTWGRHKDRTRPVPGNHEYHIQDAAGYFEYFDNIEPYYAYTLGSWRIYALNSEIDVGADSPQVTWLLADLAANPSECVLAYWHRPRWSSGNHHGSNDKVQTLWQIFYDAGAELVINGHEHHYERFAEMDANGARTSSGLREIVVGTGGRSLYEFGSPLPASEVRLAFTSGILKLTLHPDSYDWDFIPVAGSTFTDQGRTPCH